MVRNRSQLPRHKALHSKMLTVSRGIDDLRNHLNKSLSDVKRNDDKVALEVFRVELDEIRTKHFDAVRSFLIAIDN